MNEIEEIKQRLDLVELVGQYVTLKKAGANYKGVCPFHQEKTPSLMVSPEKQIWKCFGCGKGGDHYKFVMEAEHLEFGDALKLLAQKAGVTLQPKTRAEHQTRDKKETLYAINDYSSRVFHKILLEQAVAKSALDYIKKRGLDDETITKFCLGFAPKRFDLKQFLLKKGLSTADIAAAGSPEKFFERIMFPIFDVLGNVIAFTGRALGDNEPKYLNSPETPIFNKSRTLYGLNFAKAAIKEKNYVILVEGQMDVIALHQHGFAQTVASSGTAITERQLEILSKYTPNFLLAFDNDKAGALTTRKTIELLLRLDLNSKVVDFGSYKDAGELFEHDPKAWPQAVKGALEGIDWLLEQTITAAGNVQYIENKKQILKEILPILALVVEPARLDFYLQRLATRLTIKPESLTEALERVKIPASTQTTTASQPNVQLTNEEQLLAWLLYQPTILDKFVKQLANIAWQSADAERIAKELQKIYTTKTLTNQPSVLSLVKTTLDSQLAEKIDAWQFWVTNQWPDFNETLAAELVTEKLTQLATKDYERQKETLANNIRRAQEAGDMTKIKQLMEQLNTLTKKAGES